MKTTVEANKKGIQGVTIDPELNQYDNVVLFPEKLAKAKEQLKKSGLPKLPETKHNR
ncbi:MAG: hypothetical protein V5804_03715 [Mucilaginibacter sp.]|uniref:hypothetical protein n=1 Tax=Mucilaginibacter sp. TaxID=1882438 RepID=UPI0034E584A0